MLKDIKFYRSWSDLFKIALRVGQNASSLDQDLSDQELYIISEIFRFVFVGMRNGKIFLLVCEFLDQLRGKDDGLSYQFDSYFKFMTTYCKYIFYFSKKTKYKGH